MKKEQQDLAWASLSKEMRARLKERHKSIPFNTPARNILNEVFGHHNLTSNKEPSELLFVEKKKVQEIYQENLIEQHSDSHIQIGILYELFGDKCLPDKKETCICVHTNGTACKHYNDLVIPNRCTLKSCKFESKFLIDDSSVQIENINN